MRQGQIRIIGGHWRGRRLPVPSVPGLRPTPDRVRETVFNWLAPKINGATCLDAFAGTGAFGFEALSRGAGHVVMLDQSALVIKTLQQSAIRLNADKIEIRRAAMPKIKFPKPFDIVFLDPPYQSELLIPSCFHLEEQAVLVDGAYIYLEAERTLHDTQLPPNWTIIKSHQAGQVAYHLVLRS